MSGRLSVSAFTVFLTFLVPCDLAKALSSDPFEYAFTLQKSAGSFGRGLGEYRGNLLVGSTGSAYLYDIQTGGVVQEYLNAGGIFNSGGWIDAFGDKIAVGSTSGNGTVRIFDATSGAFLQAYGGSESGDRFGWSLASNGDLLFVGAPELRQGTTYYGQGKVVLIDDLGNRSTVHNPEPGSPTWSDSESFGYDVEVINNDLYVGALYDDDGGKVWHISAVTGATLREYSNPDGTLGNGGRPQFGDSLAVSDEYLLVGANQSSASGVNASGAAYLFDRATGNLVHRFFDPDPGVLDNFGIEVAIVDRYAIVGAHADGAGAEGSVFVFDTETGGLLQTIQSPTLSPRFFGLEMSSVGSRYLAISETTGNGIVHVYSLIPEPTTVSLCCVCVMMFFTRRGFPIS